jgi:thioredoxin 1
MAEINDQNFFEELKKSEKPVLVDFFAEWCPPCSMLAPILENIEKDFGEKVWFLKMNVDSIPLTSQKLGIDKIPAVMIFKNGEVETGFIGLRPEIEIRKWLEDFLKDNSNDEVEQLIREYEDYAKENGFRLNPDREIVKKLVAGIIANKKKYGEGYCPCRRVTGNAVEDRSKICPCSWHREEIEKDGHCLCGLFQK